MALTAPSLLDLPCPPSAGTASPGPCSAALPPAGLTLPLLRALLAMEGLVASRGAEDLLDGEGLGSLSFRARRSSERFAARQSSSQGPAARCLFRSDRALSHEERERESSQPLWWGWAEVVVVVVVGSPSDKLVPPCTGTDSRLPPEPVERWKARRRVLADLA